MTRKDYLLIADIIADAPAATEVDGITLGYHFASWLEKYQPNFDRRRFSAAILTRLHLQESNT